MKLHNNSINRIITTLKLFLEHENQLWRLNDSILTNKAGVWNPSKKWKFIDIDSIFVHIEDASSNKNVLTAKHDNTIVEETLNEAKAEQKWEKGTPNGEGFFVLISSSKKFLTATSADGLEIKGMVQLVIKSKLFYLNIFLLMHSFFFF